VCERTGQLWGIILTSRGFCISSIQRCSSLEARLASRLKIWPRPWPRPRDILATTARHRSFRSQAPMNRPNNFCDTSPTSTPTLSTTLRLNWQNSSATFQCCSPCLIDCFASRQALLQSREFSRRAV